GNVDFRPSMRGAVLTFAHLDVAGDESRPEPPMPRALHHEHREVAARSSTEHQRLVRQLDSGFLAPGIFERLMDVSIELVQKIEGANDLSGAVEVMQPILQLRTIVRIAGKAGTRPASAGAISHKVTFTLIGGGCPSGALGLSTLLA